MSGNVLKYNITSIIMSSHTLQTKPFKLSMNFCVAKSKKKSEYCQFKTNNIWKQVESFIYIELYPNFYQIPVIFWSIILYVGMKKKMQKLKKKKEKEEKKG